MTSPIILGLIAELNSQLPLGRVVAMSLDLADRIIAGDPDVDDDVVIFGPLTVGLYRDQKAFWESPSLVNCMIASLLESETMRIANPILAAYPNTSREDRDLVIRATDQVQIEAALIVADQLAKKYGRVDTLVLRAGDNDTSGQWDWLTEQY